MAGRLRRPAPPARSWSARWRAVPSAALAIALGVGACSQDDESAVPAACKSGPDPIVDALAAAPGEVRLDGTPLSGCLTRSSDPADVQAVGATYVEVAARLAPEARRDPDGAAATRLGYLIGAVERGAGETQGIHEELIRRLEQEASVVDGASAAFQEGERAGRASG